MLIRLLPLSVLGLYLAKAAIASPLPSRHAFSPDGTQPRAAAQEVTLAVEGRGVIPIVISPTATAEMEETAAQVAGFLGRITGGAFQVERSAEPRGITLGTLKEYPDPSLEGPLKIGDWNDGKEAFAIRTGEGTIRLIGASVLGAQHAAYRFLELLGVRRYFASAEWEIVPHKPNLAFDAEEESRPAIPSRRIWMAFGDGHGEQGQRRKADFASWSRHNRMGQSTRLRNSHMYQEVYRKNKAELDANKEDTYAVVKGKQEHPRKFNLANPRIRELLLETALAPLERDSNNQDMVSIEPSDGAGWSESPENVALGTISDRAFGLANDLAARLRSMGREDVQVGILAYHMHAAPPSAALDRNINVVLATRMYHGPYDLPRLKELWTQKTSNLGIYDYFSTYVWGQERIRAASAYAPAADPIRVAEVVAEAIDLLQVRAFVAESLDNWALYGPGYYVAVHKMWNRDADAKALLSDFYRHAFGPAEKPAREFYELLYPSSNRGVNYDTFRRLYEKLDEAGRLAHADPAVTTRIDRLKQALHANLLTYRKIAADDEEEKKRLALEYYTFIYRTQDGNMLGAVAVLDTSAPKDKLLDLQDVKRKDYPWEGLPPVTQEETAATFLEDFSFLKQLGEPVETISFSNDLVVRTLSDAPRTATVLATNPRVTFVAQEAGPVTLGLKLAPRSSQGEVTYQIFDSKNRQIAKGVVSADTVATHVEIRADLPAPGVYHLRVPEYPFVTLASQSLPTAVVADPQLDATYTAVANEPTPFFYVPRGITELVVNVGMDTKMPLVVHDSSGHKREATPVFGIARIPVPPGEDGTLWSLGRNQRAGSFFFLNIPNIYSLDAQRALLPRELAEHEGKQPR